MFSVKYEVKHRSHVKFLLRSPKNTFFFQLKHSDFWDLNKSITLSESFLLTSIVSISSNT